MSDKARNDRKAELESLYPEAGMKSGERLQGEYFLRVVDELDQMDRDFAESWMRHIYDFMYQRNVLDDRTRTLVIIGQCSALGETYQLGNHIRTALSAGATPEEILEVILQSSIYAGHPKMVSALRAYRKALNETGLADYKESLFRDRGNETGSK